MSLSIKDLADLADISTKTLRYYDKINLLTPHSYSDAGYRQYTQYEVDRLHHILLYKSLGLPLEQIRLVLDESNDNTLALLQSHYQTLLAREKDMQQLLNHLALTIQHLKGETTMTNKQKFSDFKQDIINSDARYGDVLRETYGDQVVDASQKAMSHMTESEFNHWQDIETKLLTLLTKHAQLTVPSDESQSLFTYHKNWLQMSWGNYSAQRHHGLGQLYLYSPDFTAYYDSRSGKGATAFLVQVINYHTTT